MKDSRISRIYNSNQRPFLQAKRGRRRSNSAAPPFCSDPVFDAAPVRPRQIGLAAFPAAPPELPGLYGARAPARGRFTGAAGRFFRTPPPARHSAALADSGCPAPPAFFPKQKRPWGPCGRPAAAKGRQAAPEPAEAERPPIRRTGSPGRRACRICAHFLLPAQTEKTPGPQPGGSCPTQSFASRFSRA